MLSEVAVLDVLVLVTGLRFMRPCLVRTVVCLDVLVLGQFLVLHRYLPRCLVYADVLLPRLVISRPEMNHPSKHL